MSKTLFWYLLRDLLRIFALATLTLSGIMTFGGLLRPLTETGLDTSQVGRLLAYMTPAMAAYCLPVAALFATTFVYGRFSADNEITAMRACGIGFMSLRRFSISLPAVVLGLVTALLSLLLLSFIVPIYTLKVEQVMYSNIAKVIAANIEKSHEMDFPGRGANDVTVYARSAILLDDPQHPEQQVVQLMQPAIVNYQATDPLRPLLHIPRDFSLAQSATVYIERTAGQAGADQAMLYVNLKDSLRFPRQFSHAGQPGGQETTEVEVGIGQTTIGPVEIPSLVHENVKFMDIARLQSLRHDLTRSQKVQTVLTNIVLLQQKLTYERQLQEQLANTPDKMLEIISDESGGGSYRFGGAGAVADIRGDKLFITVPSAKPGDRPLRFEQRHGAEPTLWATAGEIQLHCGDPNRKTGKIPLTLELEDALVKTPDNQTAEHKEFPRAFDTALPAAVRDIEKKTLADFLNDPQLSADDRHPLYHQQVVVENAVICELNGRASFGLSCLVLVLMGCPLGMMFKSGNFLTAFAVSFLPALLCIMLIVCGQQMATHVPDVVGFANPLQRALVFIWAGNVLVIIGAAWLNFRLQRR